MTLDLIIGTLCEDVAWSIECLLSIQEVHVWSPHCVLCLQKGLGKPWRIMGQSQAVDFTKCLLGHLSPLLMMLPRVCEFPGGLIPRPPWRPYGWCSRPGPLLSTLLMLLSSPQCQAPVISILLLKNLLIMLNVCAPPPVHTWSPNPQRGVAALEKESLSE